MLKFFQKIKIKIKKLKTYGGLCLFQGLSNDTTLRLIQSGRTVPLSFFIKERKMFNRQNEILTKDMEIRKIHNRKQTD